MKALINHPGLWLEDEAADSLARFEARYGKQPITSAGRTVGEQNAFISRYNNPKTIYDRPPYLFAPAPSSGPNKSRHIDGKAIDTSDPDAFHAHGDEYGFRFLYPYDVVHFEYNRAFDKHVGESPTPPNNSQIEDNLEMARPTFIKTPSGQYVSVGGKVANLLTPGNVAQFQKENAGQYDTIWLPEKVAQNLSK